MKFKVVVPTVKEYYDIYYSASVADKISALVEYIVRTSKVKEDNITVPDVLQVHKILSDFLHQKRQESTYKAPKILLPEVPKLHFETVFYELKTVSDYTKMSFLELNGIDVLTFFRYYRDAIIYNLSKYDSGREKLEEAWLLEQNKADRTAIAKFLKECDDE